MVRYGDRDDVRATRIIATLPAHCRAFRRCVRTYAQFNRLITQYNQAVQDYNALSRNLLSQESPVPPTR